MPKNYKLAARSIILSSTEKFQISAEKKKSLVNKIQNTKYKIVNKIQNKKYKIVPKNKKQCQKNTKVEPKNFKTNAGEIQKQCRKITTLVPNSFKYVSKKFEISNEK